MSLRKPNTTEQMESTPAARHGDLPGQQMLPAVVQSVLGSIGARAFHNFSGTPMEVWRWTSLATGPDAIPAKDGLNQIIDLMFFHCMQVQIAGLSPGEYSDGLRVALIDKQGKCFAFTSDGVAKDLASLIATFGMGPYIDKMPIRVVQFETRMKRRAYTIQPA